MSFFVFVGVLFLGLTTPALVYEILTNMADDTLDD